MRRALTDRRRQKRKTRLRDAPRWWSGRRGSCRRLFSEFLRRFDAAHAAHVDVHENHGESEGLEFAQKRLPAVVMAEAHADAVDRVILSQDVFQTAAVVCRVVYQSNEHGMRPLKQYRYFNIIIIPYLTE